MWNSILSWWPHACWRTYGLPVRLWQILVKLFFLVRGGCPGRKNNPLSVCQPLWDSPLSLWERNKEQKGFFPPHKECYVTFFFLTRSSAQNLSWQTSYVFLLQSKAHCTDTLQARKDLLIEPNLYRQVIWGSEKKDSCYSNFLKFPHVTQFKLLKVFAYKWFLPVEEYLSMLSPLAVVKKEAGRNTVHWGFTFLASQLDWLHVF